MDLKKAKLLLVEDNPDHIELIMDALEMESNKNEIVLMNDGLEAIDYLNETDIDASDALQAKIGMVILDLSIPGVYGMEVLKSIKQNHKYRSVPVIIFSASSDEKTISDAYRNGANAFITKSTSYEDFTKSIRSLNEYW